MKVTFIGAGSTVFAKSVLGDCILTPEIGPFDICLFDIDEKRLNESCALINNINKTHNGKATVTKTLNSAEALSGADFVVNAIQVGGYEPCTVTDFEIPKKYGLRQTIADTLGIGGIFRALRTIPVLSAYVEQMEKLCPNAYLINYTNPMAMLTGYIQSHYTIKTVGLCHSVQSCVPHLLHELDLPEYLDGVRWEIAGINHQSWLLRIEDKAGNNLYPEIKRRAALAEYNKGSDLVRFEILRQFGYYNTESSEHTAEYTPWFIKARYPELIERFKIPLDEYPRRCVAQIEGWNNMRSRLMGESNIAHVKTQEFASYIINAVANNRPYVIHGNVMNTGLITNLPANACVEVPCLINNTGINPCYVGGLPEQCAAINRTNINVQLLTMKAAETLKKDYIYMAAMLDPHTGAELSMDDIRALCDDLIEAHGDWLPRYY